MLRRQARLRREYFYRKSVETREKTIFERKRKLKEALSEGKQIPTELKKDEAELKNDVLYDDVERDDGRRRSASYLAITKLVSAPPPPHIIEMLNVSNTSVNDPPELTTHQDDEYVWAGVEDPKVVITTSHNPSSRLKQFAKELRLMFPNCQRMNRGNYVISQLVHACTANNITDLIIVHEHRGEPDGLVICHLPFGPTASFSITNTVMRHDIPDVGTMSEAAPHLIFHNFKTELGLRVQNILKYLYPVPKPDSKRVMTFANHEDYISFRHHVYKKSGHKEIELKEVGPRFELRLYEIRLGTVDQPEADTEWRLKPYMNTAKKRLALSNAPGFEQ